MPVEQLRDKWQQGLFNTGYLLTFPWKVWPTTDKVRVAVRFTLLDGRPFEAEDDHGATGAGGEPAEGGADARAAAADADTTPVLPLPKSLPTPSERPMPSEGPTLPSPTPAS